MLGANVTQAENGDTRDPDGDDVLLEDFQTQYQRSPHGHAVLINARWVYCLLCRKFFQLNRAYNVSSFYATTAHFGKAVSCGYRRLQREHAAREEAAFRRDQPEYQALLSAREAYDEKCDEQVATEKFVETELSAEMKARLFGPQNASDEDDEDSDPYDEFGEAVGIIELTKVQEKALKTQIARELPARLETTRAGDEYKLLEKEKDEAWLQLEQAKRAWSVIALKRKGDVL